MVNGIDKFKAHFKDYTGNYIIIGGTACDIIIEEAGFVPRATKDFDIILIVEALAPEFVKQFWEFIKAGQYGKKEKNSEERKYYRFTKPADNAFPKQIELFSKIPDLIDLDDESHLTPIPVDDDLSSLSAILMNDEYYQYTLEHSTIEDDVHIAGTEALICLKAKAFLDMHQRKVKGEDISSRNIRKHKSDVFRLAVMLAPGDKFSLPESIKKEGYKKTKIGWIPEDWSIYKGQQINKKITKGASPKWQGFSYQDSGILFITSENVRDGFLDITNPKYLLKEFNDKQKTSVLRYGDVLINIVGASIGRACIYNEHFDANTNQAVAIFRTNSIVNNQYLSHYLNLPTTKRRLLGIQSDGARPNLTLSYLKLFQFIIPPNKEQGSIASCLSTWDRAIHTLTQLIQQKQKRKKWLMQVLLTGKKRLPYPKNKNNE